MNNVPHQDKTPSFHIEKCMDENTCLPWWPLCGFGQYVSNLSEAKQQFKEYKTIEPINMWKLYKCSAVKQNGKIVGVINDCELLETHRP